MQPDRFGQRHSQSLSDASTGHGPNTSRGPHAVVGHCALVDLRGILDPHNLAWRERLDRPRSTCAGAHRHTLPASRRAASGHQDFPDARTVRDTRSPALAGAGG